MSLLTELKEDHRALKAILSELKETTERAKIGRTEGFAKLKDLLTAHSKAEEKALYADLEKDEKAKDQVLEGYEEHHVAELLLKEISALPIDDERWGAKIEVLKEALEHHIKEEEEEIFADARRIFSASELNERGEVFVRLKGELMSEKVVSKRAS